MVTTTGIPVDERRPSDARVIGLVSAAHFVSHLYALLLPPVFALIHSESGLSYRELAAVLASYNMVSAALQTPTGFLVDRLGASRLLIAGLLLGSTAIAVAALIPTYSALVICFGVAGLANTVYHPSDYAILSHAVAQKRIGQAFSIHTFSGLLGFAAAPPLMLISAGLWGWHGALLVSAAIGLVVALVLLAQRHALAVTPTAPAQRQHRPAGAGWRLLMTPAILKNLAFFTMLALAGGGISNFSIVALVALYDTPLWVANTALSGFLLMGALGVLLGGVIADRTRHHTRVAGIGFALSASVILVIGTVALGSAPLIALMGIAGLLSGIIQPSRDMIVRAVTPAGSFGKVFGFVTTGFNLGGVVGPLFFGWLMDRGEPRAIFIAVVAITLVSLLTVSTTRVLAPKPVAAD
ncbi:MAG TPA: MFS transporter [Stellaceae bacterium]|nr:MFS transporter [Stellaceae bacterium]